MFSSVPRAVPEAAEGLVGANVRSGDDHGAGRDLVQDQGTCWARWRGGKTLAVPKRLSSAQAGTGALAPTYSLPLLSRIAQKASSIRQTIGGAWRTTKRLFSKGLTASSAKFPRGYPRRLSWSLTGQPGTRGLTGCRQPRRR